MHGLRELFHLLIERSSDLAKLWHLRSERSVQRSVQRSVPRSDAVSLPLSIPQKWSKNGPKLQNQKAPSESTW